jgi:hypothetical protein
MAEIEPTPADHDVGVKTLQDIDSSKCMEWALKDIEKTRKVHQEGWKFLRNLKE